MATITTDKPRIAEIPTGVEIDPVTLDIIEGALKSARYEMDAVLFRSRAPVGSDPGSGPPQSIW